MLTERGQRGLAAGRDGWAIWVRVCGRGLRYLTDGPYGSVRYQEAGPHVCAKPSSIKEA